MQYFAAWDWDVYSYPIINLNRFNCDTFIVVENGIVIDGFVYCRHAHHPIKQLIGKPVPENYTEISHEEYEDNWHWYIKG